MPNRFETNGVAFWHRNETIAASTQTKESTIVQRRCEQINIIPTQRVHCSKELETRMHPVMPANSARLALQRIHQVLIINMLRPEASWRWSTIGIEPCFCILPWQESRLCQCCDEGGIAEMKRWHTSPLCATTCILHMKGYHWQTNACHSDTLCMRTPRPMLWKTFIHGLAETLA